MRTHKHTLCRMLRRQMRHTKYIPYKETSGNSGGAAFFPKHTPKAKIMDNTSIQDLIRIASRIALSTFTEMADKNPKYLSEKQAKAKYKGLVELWEKCHLITSIPTENGKYRLYSESRLAELYLLYTEGRL